jgi:hypothetical protein
MERPLPDLKCRVGWALIAADYCRDVPGPSQQGNVPQLWLSRRGYCRRRS